jgi:hypothetical protein
LNKYPSFTKLESGELIRNYYCVECFKGPFNKRHVGEEIIELGYGPQKFYICRKCCSMKFPNMNISAHMPGIMTQVITPPLIIEEGPIETEELPIQHNVNIEDIPAPEDMSIPEEFVPEEEPVIKKVLIKKPAPEVKPVIKETPVNTAEPVDLKSLTGAQIIDLIKKLTGELITLSPKSKQSIIRRATEILLEKNIKLKEDEASVANVSSSATEVDLRPLSATQIISTVQSLTGELITIGPKSKQRIINRAVEILREKNFKVKI